MCKTYGDQESALGQRLSDLAERSHLFSGRSNAAKAVIFFLMAEGGFRAGDGAVRLLNVDVSSNIAAVERCAIQMRLLISLGLSKL